MTKMPNSVRHLDDSLRRACGGSVGRYMNARTIMANTIVASLLPEGVVKGGSAIKMRLGDARTRFTTDLDTAAAHGVQDQVEGLERALAAGWGGFSGRIVPRVPAAPKDIPSGYVMRPFDVKLSYMGKPWCTVPLEVGHNEIGDADVADWCEFSDAAELFNLVGLPAPGKVPLMTVPYQVAQKLHALTCPGERARDMIDLQLIAADGAIDYGETRKICERLFTYRKMQQWPPVVVAQPGWDGLYIEQASGLPVIQDVGEAVEWANVFVRKIDAAR